jgi:hypothetical protein
VLRLRALSCQKPAASPQKRPACQESAVSRAAAGKLAVVRPGDRVMVLDRVEAVGDMAVLHYLPAASRSERSAA